MKNLIFHNEEFESEVRNELLIYDRPITEEDALLVYDLDCSNFTFDIEDCETLCSFKNLDWLSINIGFEDFSFLQRLEFLEELSLEFYRKTFDVSLLAPLKNLRSLFISGGDLSNFRFVNTDAFAKLTSLKDLTLHEFGYADLSFLKEMPYLEGFYCGYAIEVSNIDSIASLGNMDSLTLIDIDIKSLAFLDTLKDDMLLDLLGINVTEDYDIERLKRFREVDVSETIINGMAVNMAKYEE